MAGSGIYEIVNLVNGKRYVGSAVNIKKRWYDHKRALRSGRHHSVALQRAWQKYGEDRFEFRILLNCEASGLIASEQSAFDRLSPEYNICKVAGSALGLKHSPEARERIAEWNRGRSLTPEHVEAIRRSRIGKQRPDMVGNRYGSRTHTKAQRLINSSSKKGRPKAAATRAKIAAAAATPEMRARRSEFMKEIWARRKAAL